jgi:hypothetical protein
MAIAKRKETLDRVTAVYTETIDNVSPSAGLLLHWTRLTTMINWNKQHSWMPILLPLKWHVNGMLSLVNFFPTCDILLYAVWGGSHMVYRTSLVVALTGDFKVSVTI